MGLTTRRGAVRACVVGAALALLLTTTGTQPASGGQEGGGNQPDVLVSKSDASFIGGDVYNTTAAGQTLTRTKPRGSTASFYVRLQNDGPEDVFVGFKGCAGNGSFQVRYFAVDENFQNPTDLTYFVTQGWTGPVDAESESSPFLVRIKVKASAPAGAVLNCKFKVDTSPDGVTYFRDAVKMVVRRA